MQVLQDMIGDLTSAPEPVRIELSRPMRGAAAMGAEVADAIGAIQVSGKPWSTC